MVPFDIGYDARHVDLTFEAGTLPRPDGHVVHDILNVGLPAGFDWKKCLKIDLINRQFNVN